MNTTITLTLFSTVCLKRADWLREEYIKSTGSDPERCAENGIKYPSVDHMLCDKIEDMTKFRDVSSYRKVEKRIVNCESLDCEVLIVFVFCSHIHLIIVFCCKMIVVSFDPHFARYINVCREFRFWTAESRLTGAHNR